MYGTQIILRKKKYTPAVRSKISSKFIFTSCVIYPDRTYYWVCVVVKDVLLCGAATSHSNSLYEGQQGDADQSVHGNNKTRS